MLKTEKMKKLNIQCRLIPLQKTTTLISDNNNTEPIYSATLMKYCESNIMIVFCSPLINCWPKFYLTSFNQNKLYETLTFPYLILPLIITFQTQSNSSAPWSYCVIAATTQQHTGSDEFISKNPFHLRGGRAPNPTHRNV